jgi:tryptophan 2,3-dioxygenase
MIEIYCTDLIRLVTLSKREELKQATLEEQFENIYWKYGASELSTGKQTLTLQQFIAKYSSQLFQLAQSNVNTNFSALYQQLKQQQHNDLASVEEELRKLDLFVNVEWPLSHYKSAVRYLERDPVDIAATGGTNWQKYLPPRFQKRIFYPELWTEEQIEQWGKSWVMNVLKAYRT